MKARHFRPALTECEDRLTPAASAAQIIADLQIVQLDSAILRSAYNDPAQVEAKGNEQVGQAFMTAIANQSATAVADLTPFVGELQSQIAANPALSGLLGAYVGQVQAAIVTADLNAGYSQFFQQVIGAALQQHQALANAISAATSSTSSATTPTSSTSAGTSSTGSQQATVNPNGTITVNGANGPITLPNPSSSTSTGTGTTTTPSTGSTGTTPTSENTSGSGTATTNTPPTSSTTGTTQTGATSSVSSASGTTNASGTGGNAT